MSAITREFEMILDRKENPEEGSYTNYLFDKGIDKILKKVGEEATEVVVASLAGSKEELTGELCDLLYHCLVLMADKGLDLSDIEKELDARAQKQHNKKAERQPITHR